MTSLVWLWLLLLLMKLQLMLLEMGITHNAQVFGITGDTGEHAVIASSFESVAVFMRMHILLIDAG